MAWNNGFPMTYNQYPQGYQMPMYGQQMAQSGYQASQMQQPVPQMTPPTIRAEIVQIEDEAAVDRFPVAAGASQMFITRAEDKIIIKTMGQDGPMPLVVFDKRPPDPPAPKFDPAEYMRKDDAQKWITEQVETLVSAALAAQKATGREIKGGE